MSFMFNFSLAKHNCFIEFPKFCGNPRTAPHHIYTVPIIEKLLGYAIFAGVTALLTLVVLITVCSCGGIITVKHIFFERH